MITVTQAPTGVLEPKKRAPFDPDVVWSMWRREVLRYSRDRSQLFGGLSRTLLWLVVLGFGIGASLREIEGYTYTEYIFPGVIVLNVLFASMQSAIALVWDRQVGLLREVMVSPAPMFSVALGKILGGATVATLQGLIPLAVMALIRYIPEWANELFNLQVGSQQLAVDIDFTLKNTLLALLIIFALGVMLTALGIVIASRMKTFEGFGAISNGVIQPMYFLSGSIFPLKGNIGGTGFLDIPMDLRMELERIGVRTIGGAWLVQLPDWLTFLVMVNPVTYFLDLLRRAMLEYGQLFKDLDPQQVAATLHMPQLATWQAQKIGLGIEILIAVLLPIIFTILASLAMVRMRQSR